MTDPVTLAAALYASAYAERLARTDSEAALYVRVLASDLRAGMHLNQPAAGSSLAEQAEPTNAGTDAAAVPQQEPAK